VKKIAKCLEINIWNFLRLKMYFKIPSSIKKTSFISFELFQSLFPTKFRFENIDFKQKKLSVFFIETISIKVNYKEITLFVFSVSFSRSYNVLQRSVAFQALTRMCVCVCVCVWVCVCVCIFVGNSKLCLYCEHFTPFVCSWKFSA
jgi:hypothetical protein